MRKIRASGVPLASNLTSPWRACASSRFAHGLWQSTVTSRPATAEATGESSRSAERSLHHCQPTRASGIARTAASARISPISALEWVGARRPPAPEQLSGGRQDVLVDPEHVVRVVRRLDLREAGVVRAVGRLHARLALVHHEVDVGAARRVRVQRLPVADRPVASAASPTPDRGRRRRTPATTSRRGSRTRCPRQRRRSPRRRSGRCASRT